MLLEGFVDFTRSAAQQSFVGEHYEYSLTSDQSFFRVSGAHEDGYCRFSISSYHPVTKACRRVSNFAHTPLYSFADFQSLLNDSDSALRTAIWYDEIEQEIHIGSDLFGKVPLYYIHVPDRFFAISSSLPALVKKKCVREFLDINTDMLASYLEYRTPHGKPVANSYYRHVRLGLPGHTLKVSKSGFTTYAHVKLQPEKWAHLSTSAEYHEAVRNVFQKAVETAVSGDKHRIASHLSGGLDSSSVSAMFRHSFPNRDLHTLFHFSHGMSVDESPYARSVANKIGSVHHEVFQSKDDFGLMKTHSALFGEPEIASLSPSLITTMIPFARDLGCTLLLQGTGGDAVIGHGIEMVYDLFRLKDWMAFQYFLEKRVKFSVLSREYPDWASYSHEKKAHLVLQDFLYKMAGPFRRAPYRQLWSFYRELNTAVGIDKPYFLRRALSNYFSRIKRTGAIPPLTIATDELRRKNTDSISEPLISESLRGGLSPKYQSHFEDVFSRWRVSANNQQFALGKFYGIECRSVYMDKDLFELCLAVPDEIKFGDGIGRAHLRNAMTGILPEMVRNRSDKATLASAHGHEITLRLFNQAREFLFDNSHVWQYVDRRKFDAQVVVLKNEKIPHTQKNRTRFHITRTVSLALWLEWRQSVVNTTHTDNTLSSRH